MQFYMKKICLMVVVLIPVIFSSSNDRPLIESPSGKYRGHILKTINDRDILAFQGIPYALPPTGSYRFKDPVKMPKSNEILDTTDDLRECLQREFDFLSLGKTSALKGSENCLYLNVYTLQMPDNSKKLPVLFWIHGGAYLLGSGSTSLNGPEHFLDKDMILVTINYRLGALGFLSTGDSILPGNLGMKDQALALQWVKENIAAFGGDPELITLGGVSAGAASVVQHMYSKMSKGLFQGAIAQSGTMDAMWATKTRKDARDIAEKYAAAISCPIKRETFIKCLQEKSIDELFKADLAIKDPMGILEMLFVPVIEEDSSNAFLTDSSIRSDSNIPLIIGVTNYESLNLQMLMLTVNAKYMQMSALKEDHEKILPVVSYYTTHPDSSKITRELVKYYFGKEGWTETSSAESLVNINGDLMFNHPLYLRSQKHKGPVYKYMFSYKSNLPLNPFLPKGLEDGVAHSEDQLYIFDFTLIPHKKFEGEDKKMSEQLIEIYYDFIKTGNPTPESKLWEESAGGVKYLDFTNQGLIMKSNMFQSRMEFLDKLNIDRRPIWRHEEL